MALIECDECGQEISDKAEACPKCGMPLRKKMPQRQFVPVQTKSRGAAIALALILGGLGIHRFYLNQPIWGLLYMLFCWTFIPSILGFLEAICYLSYSDQAFQKKYAT